MYAASFRPSASIPAMNGVMSEVRFTWPICGPRGIPIANLG